MQWLLVKYALSALLVVLVSEAAKRSDKLGALLAALPLVTVLTLIWLQVERQPASKIAQHAYLTFWYVLPTLPMFLLFPYLQAKWSFWPALLACCALTATLFMALALVLKRWGMVL